MYRLIGPMALYCCGVLIVPCVGADDDVLRDRNYSPFPRDFNEDPPWKPLVSRGNDQERESAGFTWPTLPKPKLPTLPKPSLPKLSLPSWNTSASPPASMQDEPSVWEKVNGGTKKLYTKTKQTLMPWADGNEGRGSNPSVSAARRPPKASSRAKSKSTKKPFFSSWWNKDKDEKQVRSVNDFLSFPRVPFE